MKLPSAAHRKKFSEMPWLFSFILLFYSLLPTGVSCKETTIKSDVYEHYFAGRELTAKRDFAGALIEYENILAMAPEYVDVYTLIGKTEYEKQNFIRATYFLVLAQLINPEEEQNNLLLDQLKSTGLLVKVLENSFQWKFNEVPDAEKLAWQLYGDGRYAEHLLKANGLKKFTTPDVYRIPIDLALFNKLKFLRKFDGRIMTEELNQLKFNILEEQEENLSPEKNPAAFLQLAREYLATGHTFRFIMTIEDYTYYNISKRDNITPKEIARGLQEVNEYLDKDAKNSRGHYFKGFLLFLRQDWAAAMSEFYIAEGFKLDVKYLTRMVKYLDICRNKAREREEFISQSRAHTFVKKTAKVKQITTRIDEIAGSKSNLSQEEKIYLCTYNRSMIGKAVDFYNQDHLEEMDEMNFNLRLLVFGEYIKKPPVCPDGGVYTLLQGPVPTCSVHGR